MISIEVLEKNVQEATDANVEVVSVRVKDLKALLTLLEALGGSTADSRFVKPISDLTGR